MGFPNYKQPDNKDCGPTCLKIIAKYYGKTIALQKLRELCETTRVGSNLLKLSDAAEKIGFKTIGIKTNYAKLSKDVPLPCIVHWDNNHYIVIYKISKGRIFASDPNAGLYTLSIEDFLKGWIGNNSTLQTEEGVALVIEPTKTFYQKEWEPETRKDFSLIFYYLKPHKKLFIQLLIGLLVASILQLILPFLTQSIVDIGIQNQDLNFIYLILIAQLTIFLGSASVEIIRGWILLHLSTRINVSLISDFFIKLMNLPISYFDTRITGDLMQRINDHKRVESLITNSSLNTLFSLTNIFIFSLVIAYYSGQIFLIFLIGSLINFGWISLFLKKRKILDYSRFSVISTEQSKVIELINGMQEIKLHNAEKQKRWSWEYIQARLFKLSIKSLTLEQTQNTGSQIADQLKNLLITVTSASLVVKGEISLGMMLSIQFIIGQLNGPINQLVGFAKSVQDAKISLERLNQIHQIENEEPIEKDKIGKLNLDKNLLLLNVSFKYQGSDQYVFENLNLLIPPKKITAIVGSSGSGKTTLMKLLLKFYFPDKGSIKIGDVNINNISQQMWRESCGVVMQEGYIFNDTIAKNIAIGDDSIDREKLDHAVKTANIKDFIETLPKGYNTKIGNEGIGISTGQKQRLLIARAVYKNPEILLFDEATSSLDANNENVIMENLNQFFENRTVVIIAHRLSTVKNADQIVVIENGKIVEIGKHQDLVSKRGNYYSLVKNQLELERLGDIKEVSTN